MPKRTIYLLSATLLAAVGCGSADGQTGAVAATAAKSSITRREAPSKEVGEYRDQAADLFDSAGAVRPAKLDRMLQVLGVGDSSRAAILKLNPRNESSWWKSAEAQLAAARKTVPARACSEHIRFTADEPDAATRENSLFVLALASETTVDRFDFVSVASDLRNRARTYREFMALYGLSAATATRCLKDFDSNGDAPLILAKCGTPALVVIAQRAKLANQALQVEDDAGRQRDFERQQEINRLQNQQGAIDVFGPNGRISLSGVAAGEALGRQIDDLVNQRSRDHRIGSTPTSMAASAGIALGEMAASEATTRAQVVLNQTSSWAAVFSNEQSVPDALMKRRAAYTKTKSACELPELQALACLKMSGSMLEFDALYWPDAVAAEYANFADACGRFSAKDAAQFASAPLKMVKEMPNELMTFAPANYRIATRFALGRCVWAIAEFGDPAVAVKECDAATEVLTRLGVLNDEWQAEFSSTKAYALARTGNFSGAADAAAQAIKILERMQSPSSVEKANLARYRQVTSLCKAGRTKEALAAAEAYRTSADTAKDPMAHERSTTAMARAIAASGKVSEGRAMLEGLLEDVDRRGQANELRMAADRTTAMELAELAGDFPSAIRHCKAAIAIRAANQAPDHPRLVDLRTDLTRLQKALGPAR